LIFSEIAEVFQLSLRDQQRAYIRLKAVLETAIGVVNLHYGYLTILVMAQMKYKEVYEMLIDNRLTPDGFWTKLVGENLSKKYNCKDLNKYHVYFSGDIASQSNIERKIERLKDPTPGMSRGGKYSPNILRFLVSTLLEFERQKQLLEFTDLIS